MDEKHSVRWPENIHKPILWFCDRDHEEVMFHDNDDIDEHIRQTHSEYETESEIEELKEWCQVQKRRQRYTCPICSCVPNEIAVVVPWIAQDSSLEDVLTQTPEKTISSNLEIDFRQKLALHVASHLKTIGLMSISYLEEGDDGTSISGHASIGNDKDVIQTDDWASTPDLDFEDYTTSSPPEPLSEEVQILDWARVKPTLNSSIMQLECDITLYICEDILKTSEGNLLVPWPDQDQYTRLEQNINKLIGKHMREKYPAGSECFRTSAVIHICRSIDGRDNERLASKTLRHEHDWAQRVPLLVKEYTVRETSEHVKLEAVLSFDTVFIGLDDGIPLSLRVWEAMDSKMIKNWKNQRFIPQTTLEAIFSENRIFEMLDEDLSLLEKDEDFATELFLYASCLSAMCIFAQKPLSCLRSLVKTDHIHDDDLPLARNMTDLPEHDLTPLMNVQRHFVVHKFHATRFQKAVQDGSHELIPAQSVLPIMRVSDLGEGGFGRVEEVRIHPDYHDFNGVSSCLYKTIP